jgi:hypothetical protein
MTITDDRLIYEGLKRQDAIAFIAEKGGFPITFLRMLPDDKIAYLYDTLKRGG